MDPIEDPRIPHQRRHAIARSILEQKYPGCHVQRVSSYYDGRRVEATVILANGQSIETSVPQAQSGY